ncbi:MAG: sigma-54 interaction domain-containing protein [Lysobacterales bacterium]
MTVIKEMSRRCLVWFGRPASHEQAELIRAGWNVRIANAAEPGGVGMRRGDTVVALADLRQDGADTVRTMEQMMADHSWLPWLALLPAEASAHDPQVARILQISVDFFAAPLDLQRLLDRLALIDSSHLPVGHTDIGGMTGRSPAIHAVMASIRKYAPVELPVLITGETGAGKEVAARALHELSARRHRPFAAINCGALAPNLVQSELFGHERGSFTGANVRRIGHFESAAGGTVFLDEVGDLPLDAQTNLLRFLQEGTLERVGSSQSISVDVRVLAATHVNLEQAVGQGHFREDLYYRLNVLRLHMPALREREDDVVLLAQHFLDSFREHHNSCAHGFSHAARQALRSFAWPGNVRELLNRVQRAAVVAEDALIIAADLDLEDTSQLHAMRLSLGLARISAERDTVVACLRESRFNISECARRLKVSRVTVYRLCKKHQLELEQLR